MNKRILLACFLLGSAVAVAQEPAPQPAVPQPGAMRPEAAALHGMNPAMLMRMRDRLTFELQQTQRTLSFIDPNDTQLQKTLSDQQAELLSQLKEVNSQLTTQGLTPPDEAGMQPPVRPGGLPTPQPPVFGGSPQPAAENNGMLIQRAAKPDEMIPQPGMPRNPLPNGMMGGIVPTQPGPYTPMPPNPLPQGMMGGIIPPGAPGMYGNPPPAVPQTPMQSPSEFDQDQLHATSPWAPKPSKELTELKQTVDSLRKELGEMRDSVKALEAQIQLLNRNILMSQPAQK